MSSPAPSPKVIAFDVLQTVAPLDPVHAAVQRAGFPGPALTRFFAQLLRDAFALEVSAVFKPFPVVARASLRVVAGMLKVEADEAALEAVLQAFGEIKAAPDAQPAFDAAHDAGVRIVMLTNGSADNTLEMLERSGLATDVEHCVSIDAVGHWKPPPAVYQHAARVCGVQPHEVALVATHGWDVHGATRAGLRTGWVSRQESVPSPAMQAPDVSGASLDEMVRRLLGQS